MIDRYVVVIERGECNFGAYAPDVLGCIALGKTIEQTVKRMRSALGFHLQAMRRDGDPIPAARFKLGDPVEFPENVVGYIEVESSLPITKHPVAA